MIVGFVLAIVVSKLIVKLFVKDKGIGSAVLYIGVIILTPVFSLVLITLSATVVVVSTSETGLIDKKIEGVFFSYEDRSVEIGGDYVYNQSDEVLVLYPVYYGNGNEETQTDEAVQIIFANTFEKVEHEPDYCFYVPNSIVSKNKSKVECKWILETVTKATSINRRRYGIR